MILAELFYMVKTINADVEFPLKEFTLEFTLPTNQYLHLLKEVNKAIYDTDEYDITESFEVTVQNIVFRIIHTQ